MIKIYPYKAGSKSAKMLAAALSCKLLKISNSKYKPKEHHIVVNWGASNCPSFYPADVLNPLVGPAQDKLLTFEALQAANVNIPLFWTNQEDIPAEAYPVFARTILNAHSGAGIVVVDSPDTAVVAPLYTQYVKKSQEYRVHVFRDNSIFVQRKAKKTGVEVTDWKIRNLSNGFVFVPQEVEELPDTSIIEQAVAAVAALKLDFGGVDVIWNDHYKKAYVLEVNTACGLEERTALIYAKAILDFAAAEDDTTNLDN